MNGRRFDLRLALLLALWAWAAIAMAPTLQADDDETPPPPVGLRRSAGDRGHHVDVVVPGRLLARTWPRLVADGPRVVLLLVAPENAPDGPRTLYQVPMTGPETNHPLITLATDLPSSVNALAKVAATGDGVDTVLLGEPGTIYRLSFAGGGVTRSVLVQHDGLDLRAQPRAIDGHGIPIAEIGSLRILDPNVQDPAATRMTERLPVMARRKRAGLVLESPPVTVLDRGAGRLPLYAIGPESLGALRLRTILIDPEVEGEGRWSEIWSILPGPESVADSFYVLQDGRPRLLVATINAAKLAIFGRKRLRSFPLLADRTRQGKRSSLNAAATSRLWQPVELVIADVDNNGQDDLIVVQLDGLGGGKLAVDTYLGKGSGTYHVRVRKTVIDRRIDAWAIGHDFDGDLEPDLLVRADGTLALYPGAVGKTKKRAVAAKPSWEIDLSRHLIEGAPALVAGDQSESQASVGLTGADIEQPRLGRPTVVDLDGDGRLDVLLSARSQRGRGRLHVVLMQRD